ncbi:MAG: phosphatase PAP2 family protein [Thermoleophilia bacterium]
MIIVVAGLSGLAAALVVLRSHAPFAGSAASAMVAGHAADLAPVRRWLRRRRDPAVATGLALTIALGAVVLLGTVFGVLAYLVRGNGPLPHADRWVSEWGRDHATAFTDRGVKAVTQLGETWLVAILAVVLAAYAWRRGTRAAAPFLALVVVGNNLATNGIKALADRARPTLNPVAETLGPSFPSGHTTTAASFFAAAALVLGAGATRNRRALLAGAAVAAATAVACSRVLLAVHWLSDVAAGLALGWAWFALCAVAFGGRLLRFGAAVEEAETRAQVAAPAPETGR